MKRQVTKINTNEEIHYILKRVGKKSTSNYDDRLQKIKNKDFFQETISIINNKYT